ncbi:MAG: hypothetical protein ACK5U4_00435 [Rhodospirillales bacterium]
MARVPFFAVSRRSYPAFGAAFVTAKHHARFGEIVVRPRSVGRPAPCERSADRRQDEQRLEPFAHQNRRRIVKCPHDVPLRFRRKYQFEMGGGLDLRNKKSYFRTMSIILALKDSFGVPLVGRVGGRLCAEIGDGKNRRNMSPEEGFLSRNQSFKIGCANWRRLPNVAYFPWRGPTKPATQARPCEVDPRQLGEP